MNTNNKVEHILLVEDDEVDVISVTKQLKQILVPFVLHVATNGYEALDLLLGRHSKPKVPSLPRLIILDIMMPKMNGFEFLKELKKYTEFDHTAIIFLTTSANPSDKQNADELNISGYFIKDKDNQEFFTFCKNFLEKDIFQKQ